ncbi:MAG: ABC transporter ATP-binding protein [Patescibacteria group bacterium]|jgi:branched-chain amino acid transport system ATP-binding protein
MITISNLKSGYNRMEVLKGIDFNASTKEITAIIGPNGSGKSTILKSIFNLCDIYSGQIKFLNQEITRTPTHQLIRLGISYVPQGRQVFGNLSVRENLEIGAFIFSDRKLVEQRIDAIFKRFSFLKEKQHDYAYTLSGGQQQMLSIARALMQGPKLLLLDEPSLGLSPKMVQEVFAKLTEINQEGITIIVVEQNAKQAIAIADKIYILEEGKIALTGGKEILSHPKIKNIYLGGN